MNLTSEYPAFEKSSSLCRPCIFYAVVNAFICVLGLAGNGLVIWIACFKTKKSVNSTWYLSLAVSDFMFCSLLTFEVVYVVQNDWNYELFMCKFLFSIMYLNWFSSIFLLVIISMDRCVVVLFPVWAQNKRSVRRASLIVVVAWIISAVLITPSALVLDVEYDNYSQRNVCVDNYTNNQLEIADGVCQFMFLFVIPYLIIVICYVMIIRKLKSNQMTRSKKPFKIMTVLIVSFVICWLPFHTLSLMELNDYEHETFLHFGYLVAFIFANANSCINPFLYAFMGKDFKNQCHALLSKIENALEEDEGSLNGVQGRACTTSGENNTLVTI